MGHVFVVSTKEQSTGHGMGIGYFSHNLFEYILIHSEQVGGVWQQVFLAKASVAIVASATAQVCRFVQGLPLWSDDSIVGFLSQAMVFFKLIIVFLMSIQIKVSTAKRWLLGVDHHQTNGFKGKVHLDTAFLIYTSKEFRFENVAHYGAPTGI
mmetsp:Transcript_13433/g.38734  ORF Transcript_13433/g.38734 Transcript_13433/m.38734 type:complete len:153 (+) Transcript_13433:216-674(+)